MKVISAVNVNDAWAIAKRLLSEHHVVRPSRVGEVWEYPKPVTTVYHIPTQRVLFDEMRNCNHVFHFMEALHLLAGRQDVAWLERFNSRIREFVGRSDYQHAAYGHRLRYAFDLDGGAEDDYADQLLKVVHMLKASHNERRAVLANWNPLWDLDRPDIADIPCLAGNTVVLSPEGDVAIEDLAQQFASGILNRYPVYAVNPDNGDLRLQWCTKVWKSGVKSVLEIGFNDGTSLRCTKDHVLYRKLGSALHSDLLPVQAADLAVGDKVWATFLFAEPKGYLAVKRNLKLNTCFTNRQKVHRAYAELVAGPLPREYELHHDNEVKSDNRLSNLKVIESGEHSSLHRSGDNNPMRKMTPAQHRARGRKQSKAMKAFWKHRKAAEHNQANSNHKIVYIRELPPEPVYDFEVPGFHTALVGSGVVAHNCNTHAYLKVRGGALDMTVCCRSNDIVYGAYGSNVVQFSVLLEYLAAMIGVPVGTYYQVSDSFHAYTERWEKHGGGMVGAPVVDYYGDAAPPQFNVQPYSMVAHAESFDDELRRWFARPTDDFIGNYNWRNPFFRDVAEPLWQAWDAYKENDLEEAIRRARICQAEDWRLGVVLWFKRVAERRLLHGPVREPETRSAGN